MKKLTVTNQNLFDTYVESYRELYNTVEITWREGVQPYDGLAPDCVSENFSDDAEYVSWGFEVSTVSPDVYELLNNASEEERDSIAAIKETEYPDIEVRVDGQNWYIDCKNGLGFGQYSREDYTLEGAIEDQKNIGYGG